jgi:hypothetical protein
VRDKGVQSSQHVNVYKIICYIYVYRTQLVDKTA